MMITDYDNAMGQDGDDMMITTLRWRHDDDDQGSSYLLLEGGWR